MTSPSPHPLLQQDPTRLHPPFGLWGYLSRKSGLAQASPSPRSTSSGTLGLGRHAAPIAPLDKAGTSTRILLHDTQAHLEKFTERVTQLTTNVADAKRELVAVQKLYQEDHEQLVERMIGLVNRCQTELQKAIGSPAQSSEVRDVSRDVGALASRLDALDKKVDLLSMLNQTQSQALQTIQDQQGQILTALLPIRPFLQSVPLHIENTRKHVEDAVSASRTEVNDSISDLENRVKNSYEGLQNQLRSAVSDWEDHIKKNISEVLGQDKNSIGELRQHISTIIEPASRAGGLARGTSRTRSPTSNQSRSRKRPRAGSVDDPSASDRVATSPSDSKKRRLDGGAASSPALAPTPRTPSHPLARTPLKCIHTPIVADAASDSSQASPDIPLTIRSSHLPLRIPLADLDPRTPARNTVIPSYAPASGRKPSRSALPACPTALFQATSGTLTNVRGAAPTPVGSIRTSPLSFAAPTTPGVFELPSPAVGRSSASTSATTSPHLRTIQSRSASALQRRFDGGNAPARSFAQTPPARTFTHSTRTRTLTLRLPALRDVAVPGNGTTVRPTHGLGVDRSILVGAGGAPGTQMSPLHADVRLGSPSRPLLPRGVGVGKPMSLKDRRALLAEDHMGYGEGKRFIPLDDEEDEEVVPEG